MGKAALFCNLCLKIFKRLKTFLRSLVLPKSNDDDYKCDTYFPQLPENYFVVQKTPMSELTERGNHTYILVYKQLKAGMKVIYDFNEWTLQKIHYEDSPKLYFTIQKSDGREKQTVKERIKLK